MHEIITLQLGHQANYLGTHFWNTQESYFTYAEDDSPGPVDHNVHFRPGLGVDGGETFTPRVLIYDLKGGFGSMKKINALYEMEQDSDAGIPQGLWDREMTIQREPLVEPIEYQRNLDAGLPPVRLEPTSVRYWSDFNRVFYHPRSSIQLNEYDLNSKIMPFESFGLGRDLFNQLNREHDLLDRDFRLFAEECDQMQGVQIFTSAEDAWGGFAAEYVAALRDEYSKIGIMTWGLQDFEKVTREKQINHTVNLAYTLSNIVPLTSLYIPLGCLQSKLPGYVNLDPALQWHKSALLSVAVETCTLPTRLRNSFGAGRLGNLDDLASLLNVNGGQRIATLSMTVHNPNPNASRLGMPNVSDEEVGLSWDSGGYEFNGMAKRARGVQDQGSHIFARAEVVRGSTDDRAGDVATADASELPGDHQGAVFGRYLTSFTYPVIDSFPSIFSTDHTISVEGATAEEDQRLAVSTRLTTSSQVIPRLKSIKNVVSRVVGVDEREAILNDLGEFIEGFETGWNSGSDDYDD
ncbi:tubulin nucleotide-binding domain-like protein [Choiromyces venosus 120613-1]|uniref:Tubulin nucleotide-binding domain-like protein n=1 Tax=Choiromyces venosus 120613-1 TaxID=1336337 RepID=A0A3N4K9Y8_9PEZI|nr:tubulin nucleotide-binding domain-like protein [Choiromyces venosus 120613-1]